MTDLLRALADKFEINRGGKDNLRPLEGLRGFAMIAVLMAHYVVHAQPFLVAQSDTSKIATAIYNNSHSGVDIFFLLSGFLIYASLIKKPRPTLPWYARHIERIYPVF